MEKGNGVNHEVGVQQPFSKDPKHQLLFLHFCRGYIDYRYCEACGWVCRRLVLVCVVQRECPLIVIDFSKRCLDAGGVPIVPEMREHHGTAMYGGGA